MHQVLYYSMSGNTRKVAEAIAAELGVKAGNVKGTPLAPGNGVVFLGSGCYGGKPGTDMGKFIETNDFAGRTVAVYGTSGGGTDGEVKAMAEALTAKGARVKGSYHCPGKAWLLFSRGHPDAKDLAAARQFAREMVKDA